MFKDISENRLSFSRSEIQAVRGSFCAKGRPLSAIKGRAAFDLKGISSNPMASELTRFIGFKGNL
jgi:hypothetical protein